jgi:hypothetical protein
VTSQGGPTRGGPTGQPVSRWKVLAGALLLALFITGLVAAMEALRYPHDAMAPAQPEPAADPRDPIVCEDPIPREGQIRTTGGAQRRLRRVTSNELYDCPQTFDGSLVRYRGEVIGGVLRRQEGAWVHLNDDIYAGDVGPLPAHRDFRGGNAGVGVFIPHALAEQISHVGGPRDRGDILEVTGTFHRVDAATGEVAIVRAAQGTVTAGGPLERPLLPPLRVAAIAMFGIMAASVVAERLLRTRD